MLPLKPKIFHPSPIGGQATLSLAILVGGTAILIGLTLAFLTISFTNSASGFQAANRALDIASAGAQDALLRLARDKTLSETAGYEVQVGNHFAKVTIQNTSLVLNRALITSQATVGVAQRKIQVLAEVDKITGKVGVISWKQVAL